MVTPGLKVLDDGAITVGRPFAVIAMLTGVAEPPRLSVAVIAVVSPPADWLSASGAKSAFTWLSDPVIVMLAPDPDTPVPVAESWPLASESLTVNISPVVVPVSLILTPGMAEATPWEMISDGGAAIAGGPLVVPPPPWSCRRDSGPRRRERWHSR